MKLLVFCYDFPHSKTVQGLLWLKAHGYDDVLCVAAPKKQLNFTPSKTRISPIIEELHPKSVARSLGYKYMASEHDNPLLEFAARGRDCGVILGARILKPWVTKLLPIINMHPGLLPDNRGLDNIKWAIYHGMPQGVTVHVIDQRIDRGVLIHAPAVVDVLIDDTLLDVYLRVQSVERKLLISGLEALKKSNYRPEVGKGRYFSAMPDHIDATIEQRFINMYRHCYDEILERWRANRHS